MQEYSAHAFRAPTGAACSDALTLRVLVPVAPSFQLLNFTCDGSQTAAAVYRSTRGAGRALTSAPAVKALGVAVDVSEVES